MRSKIPMERFGTVDEAAALIAWLASRECSSRPAPFSTSRAAAPPIEAHVGADDLSEQNQACAPAAELVAALRRMGILKADEQACLRPLTGGVSSDIFVVEAGERRFCVEAGLAEAEVRRAVGSPAVEPKRGGGGVDARRGALASARRSRGSSGRTGRPACSQWTTWRQRIIACGRRSSSLAVQNRILPPLLGATSLSSTPRARPILVFRRIRQ